MKTLHVVASTAVLALVLAVCSCGSSGETPDPQPQPTEPRVVKQVFATGAAPNDMVYASESLYVANSLDNTVVRHALDGAVLATAAFDVGASPAYVAIDEDILWVVCNGDNTVVGLESTALDLLPDGTYELGGSSATFSGPGQPAALNQWVFVPRAEIAAFSPTVYNPGLLSIIGHVEGYQELQSSDIVGLNPQFTAIMDANLYLVCSGDIQFDENFIPGAVSDSYLEIFWPAPSIKEGAGLPSTRQANHAASLEPPLPALSYAAQLNLGPIGAGRIAASPDESYAYLGNSLNGNLYRVGLKPLEAVRGQDNPIVLTQDFTFVSDVAFSPDGSLLFCASFNTDEVYVVDTATDTVGPAGFEQPFDLSLDPELLAGCANLDVVQNAVAGYSYSVFVLHAVANSVSRIDIP